MYAEKGVTDYCGTFLLFLFSKKPLLITPLPQVLS